MGERERNGGEVGVRRTCFQGSRSLSSLILCPHATFFHSQHSLYDDFYPRCSARLREYGDSPCPLGLTDTAGNMYKVLHIAGYLGNFLSYCVCFTL